jgi:hypothetical protein
MTVNSIVPVAVSSQLDNSGEERIHIANTVPGGVIRQPYVAPPNPFESIFAMDRLDSTFLVHADNADNTNFPIYQDTGGLGYGSVFPTVHGINGKLFSFRPSSNRTRVSDDGINWVGTTNLTASGTVWSAIHTGTEYLIFPDFGTNNLYSADGLTWNNRTRLSGYNELSGIAKKGNTIINSTTTANTLHVSTDNGLTQTAVNTGGTSLNELRVVATANRFVALGYRTSPSIVTMSKWSTTGLAGTWTETTLVGSSLSNYIMAYLPNINRVIAIAMTGRKIWISDDEGSTWSDSGVLAPSSNHIYIRWSELNQRLYWLCSDLSTANTSYFLLSTTDGLDWSTIHWQPPINDYAFVNFGLFEL